MLFYKPEYAGYVLIMVEVGMLESKKSWVLQASSWFLDSRPVLRDKIFSDFRSISMQIKPLSLKKYNYFFLFSVIHYTMEVIMILGENK